MSQVSQPQGEQIAQHPLEAVIENLDGLLEKLRMELDVAPTDQKAHQELLRRIIRTSHDALQIPDEAPPLTVYPDAPTEAITIVEDDEEFDPEIEVLRQQGWQIMTVTQLAENVEKPGKFRETGF